MLHLLVNWAADHGVGMVGTDLFVGALPAETPSGVALRHIGGAVAPEPGNLRRMSFQATVRDPAYADAYERAVTLMSTLTLHRLDLPGAHLYACLPRQEPASAGQDASGAWSFSIEFDAVWRTAEPA